MTRPDWPARHNMPCVDVQPDRLVITFGFFFRLLTLRGELRIPVDHVNGVGPGHPEMATSRRYQMPGVWAPGTIMAGVFSNAEGRTLWAVRNIDRAVAVYLRDEKFVAAVLEVDDPDATIAEIMRAAALYRAT